MKRKITRPTCLSIVLSVICVSAYTDTVSDRYGSGNNSLLSFYQRYISPLKGGNTCPMHPSCSQYAKQAIQYHGVFEGIAASCDRYVRCGRDTDKYPRIVSDSSVHLYDPVIPEKSTGDEKLLKIAAVRRDTGLHTGEEECARFAAHLEEEGRYHLAAIEYERLLYSGQSRFCSLDAARGVLSVSYKVDGLDRFRSLFYRLLDTLEYDSIAVHRCGLFLAKKYMQVSRYEDALNTIAAYRLSGKRALVEEGYVLAALSRLHLRQFKLAKRYADSVSSDSDLSLFRTRLDNHDNKLIKYDCSPTAAGIMSALVPGSGYLYVGRPQTAFASLLVNGLFIWTTSAFFRNRYYGPGTTALFLGMGFYLGNIRGSVKAADQFNERELERRIHSLVDGIQLEW